MKFKSLIAEFGLRYGIGKLVPDADGVVGIGVDDRSVTFRRQGESDCVVALAELGDVPETGADAVNRLLMQVNQALFIEDGLVITRPEKSGRYCLLDRMDVASMDFLGFDRRISRLLAQADRWSAFLERYIPLAAEAATAGDSPEPFHESASLDMMRV